MQRTSCAEKHDGLGWSAGCSYQWYDLRLGIRTNDASILPRLKAFVPPSARPSEDAEVEILVSLKVGEPPKHKGQKNYNLVYHAWDRQVRTLDLEEAVEGFGYVMAQRCAMHCLEPFFVRGAVHAIDQGWVAVHGAEVSGVFPFLGIRQNGEVILEAEKVATLAAPAAIVMLGSQFEQPQRLTPGQATVHALNLNFAPPFLTDVARCMFRLGHYFSKSPTLAVPAGTSPEAILALVSEMTSLTPSV